MWNKEKVQDLLAKSDKAVWKAVVAIYRRQTIDEQASHATRQSNGVGFTAFDAELMSDLAKKCLRGWTMSPRQTELARKRMMKYHRQLVEIALANEAAKVPTMTPAEEDIAMSNEAGEAEVLAETRAYELAMADEMRRERPSRRFPVARF